MLILRVQLQLRLYSADSLKDKRSVVRSVKDRLRQRFRIAVAEVGAHDEYRTVDLGLAAVGQERRELDRLLSKITSFLDQDARFELVHSEPEIS